MAGYGDTDTTHLCFVRDGPSLVMNRCGPSLVMNRMVLHLLDEESIYSPDEVSISMRFLFAKRGSRCICKYFFWIYLFAKRHLML